MKFKAAGLAALAVLCVQGPALAGEILPTHPKLPSAVIFERADYGGRDSAARARVTRASAVDWCENWRPGDAVDACADEIMANEEERVYEARASCWNFES